MINPLYILAFILLLLASNCFFLIYGLRLGKAMQKDVPTTPLTEPVKEAVGVLKKIGKRTVRLVSDMKELKALKKGEKEETSVFD
jgi:hypothetical protein